MIPGNLAAACEALSCEVEMEKGTRASSMCIQGPIAAFTEKDLGAPR